jgi:3-methyladenine DNA glycosylase AlkD
MWLRVARGCSQNSEAVRHNWPTACPLIERAANDGRNFVKKGVNWALRAMARRSAGLSAAALQLARTLAASSEPSARWVGKDALLDLTKYKSKQSRARVTRSSRD